MGKKSHFFAWIIESWWRFIHFCCRLCVLYIVYINCCLMVCYLQEWIDHALKNAPLLSIYMWLCLCCCIVSNLHKIKSFSHSWKLFGCTLYKGSSALFEHFQGWFIWSHRMLLPLGSRRCSGEIFFGKKQGHFWCEEASALAFLWRGRDWLISWRPLATTAGQLLQLHVLCFVFAEVTHTRLAWRADFGWVAQIA